MITKLIGQPGTYRGINTDYVTGGPGQNVGIGQSPEESGDRIWVLDAIQYSYRGASGVTTVVGGLTIMLDDKVKFDVDITNLSGQFDLYIPSQTDKTLTVTLRSGGNGVIGKLNCQWHLEPAQ
jgi:hypothetical protein